MDDTWVKLYRKIVNNDIIRDPRALQVFIWLLAKVDRKTGQYITGRFAAAEELLMKPTTFRDALNRLTNKYRVTATSAANKCTTIRLIHWNKYNPDNISTPHSPPPSRHQNATKQEYITNNKLLGKIPDEKKPKEKKRQDKRNPDIQEGIDLHISLFGALTQQKQNRYALNRLYRTRGKEETLKRYRLSHELKDQDQFCPKIYNFLDMEKKWDQFDDYLKKPGFPKKENTLQELLHSPATNDVMVKLMYKQQEGTIN